MTTWRPRAPAGPLMTIGRATRARARVLSSAETLRRLDDRVGLLTGGARDAVARQQTLRATIDWSHGPLEGPGKAPVG
ncbi:MAG: hypothetical protein M3018_06630 [Actinomycetota bacterium]|nr:hypothetical protein [Actinomycetota bacterium]